MTQMNNATKPGLDPANMVAWHRWLQPLQGAMAGQQAPLDRKNIEAELEPYAKKLGASYRTHLLACLRTHLDAAKAGLQHAFHDNNDGAIYVGMYAWTIDILLQLLYAETRKYCCGGGDLAGILEACKVRCMCWCARYGRRECRSCGGRPCWSVCGGFRGRR